MLLQWMKDIVSGGSISLIFNLFLAAFIAYHYYFKPKKMKKQGVDRRVANNPGVKPGFGDSCKKHGEALVRLDERVGNIEGDIKEMKINNRQDHKEIFDKIDKVRNNRR